MVKVMYNDKLVYKAVIWVFWGIRLWKEKEALICCKNAMYPGYSTPSARFLPFE